MESVQLQTVAAPPGKAKPATTGTAAASPAAADPQQDFQALLLSLMGAELPKDAAVSTEQKAVTASDDTEHECAPAASAGPADAALLPGITLPIALPPTTPESIPASTNDLPATPAGADVAQLPAHTATDKRDGLENGESGSSDLQARMQAIGLEKNLSRFAAHAAEARAESAMTSNPQHALESLAEHRDAAVTSLPVPQFAHGIQQAQSANALPASLARIETPVGAPDWNTEFSQKIVWLASEKQHAAELHVNPPDLGPLRIRLSSDENQTSAIFTSPHSEVREAIEAALPRLREVLADSGITLGNASVTADSPRDGSAFDQQRQLPRSFPGAPDLDAKAEPEPARTVPRTRGSGLVDLFA